MPPVHPCVSFLFIDQDKVLLEQRSKEKSCDPDMVAIPGGHMETGESQTETLLREIREELGVDTLTYHYLCSLYHPTSELQLLHYYVVTQWQGEIQSHEADTVFWSKVTDFAPATEADKTALKELLRLQAEGLF
ncbi:NUDIX hydrolase [Vibrio vulnificus]|uniref:NUDIX hydrolase n=1 Tax=Vibrio vulnificus TaxID=672 RepID=UPI0015594BC0|nr:NUDIX domain-containing protein [Vibrio vulnificus]MDS1772777.1 NUDIX domain-containing protein [Vibrio vulnificus]MDS1853560.1 NUDIX domain-containing protein [Vibrio vulnificus]HAS6321570.1 NUDIX domain-containing protein [Vibrio vulnificus]HDY7593191.1 NUDIX domain-containing protein [Vibrio vulnificus]HDY8178211.1 NUDIX domain-containing protein [Vibrio vulnificus]